MGYSRSVSLGAVIGVGLFAALTHMADAQATGPVPASQTTDNVSQSKHVPTAAEVATFTHDQKMALIDNFLATPPDQRDGIRGAFVAALMSLPDAERKAVYERGQAQAKAMSPEQRAALRQAAIARVQALPKAQQDVFKAKYQQVNTDTMAHLSPDEKADIDRRYKQDVDQMSATEKANHIDQQRAQFNAADPAHKAQIIAERKAYFKTVGKDPTKQAGLPATIKPKPASTAASANTATPPTQ